jgi:hypothetical protein
MARVRERLIARPLDRSDNPRRLAKLKGKYRHKKIGDQTFDQWQYELSSAGRVWFCPDTSERKIWITKVALAHPKETE